MRKSSNRKLHVALWTLLAICVASLTSARGQAVSAEKGSNPKPVLLRVGVPAKQSDREVVIPLIVETSGAASVGRIRAELELGSMKGWSFRSLEVARGLELKSSVRKRNDGADKLIIEWDVSAEGKELPTGHVALLRLQAERGKSGDTTPPADNPPSLAVRKMSWGLAEFEKPPEGLPQLETPENTYGNNPDVSCFFFTH